MQFPHIQGAWTMKMGLMVYLCRTSDKAVLLVIIQTPTLLFRKHENLVSVAGRAGTPFKSFK